MRLGGNTSCAVLVVCVSQAFQFVIGIYNSIIILLLNDCKTALVRQFSDDIHRRSILTHSWAQTFPSLPLYHCSLSRPPARDGSDVGLMSTITISTISLSLCQDCQDSTPPVVTIVQRYSSHIRRFPTFIRAPFFVDF